MNNFLNERLQKNGAQKLAAVLCCRAPKSELSAGQRQRMAGDIAGREAAIFTCPLFINHGCFSRRRGTVLQSRVRSRDATTAFVWR